ncbi:RING finger protein 151-like [Saccostrea echinata]|uniref:RING finger protein 151-like n=1 Tax=Saccostrea echinata TaxID=191078 RepID=UPI002A84096F|nr:RING finger protein 151-like [Saccostrea echinata]
MTKRQREDRFDNEVRYFLNPESVSVHLFCSICQDVFQDPQRAPCGHSFCRKCILPWLRQSQSCPEDRKPVKEKQLHHDFILENIIGDQMVACPYRKSGCDYVGQLQLLASHKKTCNFNPINLPDFLKATDSVCGNDELSVDEESSIPTPGKPSLKMRLFQAGDSRKELLMSMFDKKKSSSIS